MNSLTVEELAHLDAMVDQYVAEVVYPRFMRYLEDNQDADSRSDSPAQGDEQQPGV